MKRASAFYHPNEDLFSDHIANGGDQYRLSGHAEKCQNGLRERGFHKMFFFC